ncbi:MAG: hypothetical protein GXP14_11915 [Gammaproteobacteria bacterium]|nr:hypothetical protein [Gammaproteobacteria bacterium]
MIRSSNVILFSLLLTISGSVLSTPIVSEFEKYNFYANTKKTKKGLNLYTGLNRSNAYGLYLKSQAEFKSDVYKHSLSTGLRRIIGPMRNTFSFTATTSDYFNLASAKKTIKFDSEFKKLKARYILKQKNIIHEAEGRFSFLGANFISTLGESMRRETDADKAYFIKINAQYRVVDFFGKISTTSSRVDTSYFFKSLTRRRFGWTLRGELHFTNAATWDSQAFNASLNMNQVDLYLSYKKKLQNESRKTYSGTIKIKKGLGKLNLAFEVEFANGEYKDSRLVMMMPQLNLN